MFVCLLQRTVLVSFGHDFVELFAAANNKRGEALDVDANVRVLFDLETGLLVGAQQVADFLAVNLQVGAAYEKAGAAFSLAYVREDMHKRVGHDAAQLRDGAVTLHRMRLTGARLPAAPARRGGVCAAPSVTHKRSRQ